ncbi:hypothetical protein Agabi119p4_3143 [Agaricus bisporus var. burnettii]|uniref:Uncharacterized protein n=1 Tax=Agaricus bisporus var. burnettii TaxID=192524 RepID=A0A8H7F6I6_AGABI|nr:hypothetical protein Agabi119p4_3143 [Agaricus bisporus var. burnettii]
MSSSPKDPQEEVNERQSVDELEEQQQDADHEPGTTDAAENPPVKRGRGRPKGSKNKKTVAAGAGASSTPVVPRKRGRPPKPRPEQGEPTQKRPRGRPRKNPAPDGAGADADTGSGETGGESSAKKKPVLLSYDFRISRGCHLVITSLCRFFYAMHNLTTRFLLLGFGVLVFHTMYRNNIPPLISSA